jgi:hypothetical protein
VAGCVDVISTPALLRFLRRRARIGPLGAILAQLRGHGFKTRDELVWSMYGGDGEPGYAEDVMRHAIRRLRDRYGIQIVTIKARGYLWVK